MGRAEGVLRFDLEMRVCSGSVVRVGQHALPDCGVFHGLTKKTGPCGCGDAFRSHRRPGEKKNKKKNT